MMYWQMTHIWWLLGKSYLHDIWLVELMADLLKANFILSFSKSKPFLIIENF
jgi:hypothetical protein